MKKHYENMVHIFVDENQNSYQRCDNGWKFKLKNDDWEQACGIYTYNQIIVIMILLIMKLVYYHGKIDIITLRCTYKTTFVQNT